MIADNTTLTEIEVTPTLPYTGANRLLSDAEVTLPQTIDELQGAYTVPRYGFTPQWQRIISERDATEATKGIGPNLGSGVGAV